MSINSLPLESFIQHIPGAVCIMDSNSRFVLGNTTFLSWAGFTSPDQAVGKTYGDMKCDAADCHDDFIQFDSKVKSKPLSVFGYYSYNDDWRVVFADKYLIQKENDDSFYHLAHIKDISDNPGVFNFNQFLKIKKISSQFSLFNNQQTSFIITEQIDPEISAREFECLFFLLRGKTTKETGAFLNISFRTVEHHLSQLKIKFNCQTRSQLFDWAMIRGYFNIIPKSLF